MTGLKKHVSAHGKTYGGVLLVLATIVIYFAAIHLSYEDAFRGHVRWTNGWALGISILSMSSLAMVYGFLKRWVPSAAITPETPSFVLPRRQHVIGVTLGLVFVAICLPATFRAVGHPREVQVFWVDEGATLELVQAIVSGEHPVPEYRFTQGWVTFLPVALLLKGLNFLVPVEFVLTNVAMRCYQLLVIFGIMVFTYRLVWQITRSWWLAAAVVVIAYTRSEYFHISLAIDRPDTFQLLFILLSLMFTHRFWVAGQTRDWFLAVFFAAFAFASKYSGHLLTPVLLISFMAHIRRPEVQLAYPSAWQRWIGGSIVFALSVGLIFPFTFFILSPYHLIYMESVIDFFQTHLAIYKTGNVYSLPNLEPPSHGLLWWGVFTSRYAFDYALTVLGLVGAGAALVKNSIYRSKEPRVLGEWILLSWGACYFSFLVYQYGLVDYRYIMPAQYVLPFFLLTPFLWVQQATALARVPYRTVVGFAAVAIILFLCSSRISDTLQFLAFYRSEVSVQQCFDVGRYLDKTVPPNEDPRILITNVAYVPPRFTRFEIRNVDITPERMQQSRFDYVIMTDNMYAIYADKPTAGHEQQYDPLYKVHYVDVVDTYTKFKNHQHPDYQYVTSFKDFHVFERTERIRSRQQLSSVR
jgi:Dolichyl-phosphate-mannose-protein mannosyltransferase